MDYSKSFLESSQRLKELPPYLFLELDSIKKKLKAQGKDIIDLGIGDPDLATPQEIIEELSLTLQDPENHRYPLDFGVRELRHQIAEWFGHRFGVELEPESEILPLLGSKEGIAHFPLAFINQADLVLIPEPLYPPYRSGAIFAGAKIVYLPLKAEHNFLPQIDELDRKLLKKAKLIYLNYPNNPTTAIADKRFLKKIVELAKEFKFCILFDAAYSEITFDGYRANSILEIEAAKDFVIEFHSFSKTYNMSGFRIGWACGNKMLIEYLRKLKSNIDSGIFNPIQYAGIKALRVYKQYIEKIKKTYQERRDIFVHGLKKFGLAVDFPKATFYIWTKVPKKMSSAEYCKFLLENSYIIATPGVGFGPSGEGYVRFSLTVAKERLEEALARMAKVL